METKLSVEDSSTSQRCISCTGFRFVPYFDSQTTISEGNHVIKPGLNGQKNDSSAAKAGKWCTILGGYGPDECQCGIELF